MNKQRLAALKARGESRHRKGRVRLVSLSKQSLRAVKQLAMSKSASAKQPRASSSSADFGFIPRGARISVVSWPEL